MPFLGILGMIFVDNRPIFCGHYVPFLWTFGIFFCLFCGHREYFCGNVTYKQICE